MNKLSFKFRGHSFEAFGNGALFWPAQQMLIVSDLHLGKSDRVARRTGLMLPPYDTHDTLRKLTEILNHINPMRVLCLGDSFDDIDASQNLHVDTALHLSHLIDAYEWIWIEGNHDPGPVPFGGMHLQEVDFDGVSFRHIATDAIGEVSGHFHPKARIVLRGRTISRPCWLLDDDRMIMPSFGTYTGGLFSSDEMLCSRMSATARAILTGPTPFVVPMPRK